MGEGGQVFTSSQSGHLQSGGRFFRQVSGVVFFTHFEWGSLFTHFGGSRSPRIYVRGGRYYKGRGRVFFDEEGLFFTHSVEGRFFHAIFS